MESRRKQKANSDCVPDMRGFNDHLTDNELDVGCGLAFMMEYEVSD